MAHLLPPLATSALVSAPSSSPTLQPRKEAKRRQNLMAFSVCRALKSLQNLMARGPTSGAFPFSRASSLRIQPKVQGSQSQQAMTQQGRTLQRAEQWETMAEGRRQASLPLPHSLTPPFHPPAPSDYTYSRSAKGKTISSLLSPHRGGTRTVAVETLLTHRSGPPSPFPGQPMNSPLSATPRQSQFTKERSPSKIFYHLFFIWAPRVL